MVYQIAKRWRLFTVFMAAASLCCSLARAEFPPLEEAAEFMPSQESLLANGSFNLGLGAEPFYPGWLAREMYRGSSAPSNAPPMPEIVNDGAQRNCLKLSGSFDEHALLFFRAVLNTNTNYTLHFKARATQPGVVLKGLRMGISTQSKVKPKTSDTSPMSTNWTDYSWGIYGEYPSLRLQAMGTITNASYEVLIDELSIVEGNTTETAGYRFTPKPVDMVLIPADRTGVHLHGTPYPLTWRMEGDYAQEIVLVHYLLDLGREKQVSIEELGTVDLSDGLVHEGVHLLENLKRGSYLSVVAALDAQSHEIISVGREYFSVLSDLAGLNEMEFRPGIIKGLRTNGDQKEFNWRGHWSADDYYKQCYRNGIRVQKVPCGVGGMAPYEGEYTWVGDTEINYAAANGVDTILLYPGVPSKMPLEEYNAMMAEAPDESPNNWWRQQATVVPPEWMRNTDEAYSFLRILIPPISLLTNLTEQVALRYGDKIKFVEYKNEFNGTIFYPAMLEGVAKHVYPVYKAHSPNTMLFVGTTSDIHGNDPQVESHSTAFFEGGGTNYSDGYNFHAYGGATIMPTRGDDVEPGAEGTASGIDRAVIYKERADRYGMKFGQTECHYFDPKHTAHRGKLLPWQHMQRYMIDHAFGAQVSTSLGLESLYGSETGGHDRRNRGAMPIGGSMVALNGMHRVLEGAVVQGPIVKNSHLLIGTFMTERTGLGPRYAAALAIGDNHATGELVGDFASIPDLVAYDLFGEECTVPLADGVLYLDYEILYLESSSPALFDVLEDATMIWRDGLGIKTKLEFPIDGPNYHSTSLAYYGIGLQSKGLFTGSSMVSRVDTISSDYVPNLRSLARSGTEIRADEASGAFVIDRTTLPGSGAYTKLSMLGASADAIEEQILRVGAYGSDSAVVYLNGQLIYDGPIDQDGFGTLWAGSTYSIPVGLSLIEIFLHQTQDTCLLYVAEDEVTMPLSASFSEQPADDTMASTSAPDSPQGGRGDLMVRANPRKLRMPFIKFDLRNEPGVYTNAVLKLYCTSGKTNEVWIKSVSDNSWDESSLVLSNAPFAAIQEPVVDTALAIRGTWVEFDLSSVITGPGIYSFAISEDTLNSSYITKFNSSDSQNGPILEVQRLAISPAVPPDTDGDGLYDGIDPDNDNDGVPDVEDAFELDASEWLDSDGDNIGNNADTDDDNDGVLDVNDAFPLDSTRWIHTYTLTYTTSAGGQISGDSPQVINDGSDGSAITAVPDYGYYFVEWSDGSSENPRTDLNVTADLSVTAYFDSIYPVSDTAHAELNTAGTVAGALTNSFNKDGLYEAITEELSGNTSQLEHQWTFDLYGAELLTFYVGAHHSANAEADDFVFAYSIDQTNWVDMVTVTKTTDNQTVQFYALPSNLSGTLYVRVTDADRSVNHTQFDTLFVDTLFIISDQPSMVPGSASAPSPADGFVDAPSAPVLTWTSGTQAASHEVYFGQTPSLSAADFQTNLAGVTQFDPGPLAHDTVYYWAVDEVNSLGSAEGAVWSFKTARSQDWTELTYDEFESGWGNFRDGGADARRASTAAFAHQGQYSLAIQDNSPSSYVQYSTGIDVDTPGYTEIKIEFWFKGISMEKNEDFWVRYFDGTRWHTVKAYASGRDFKNRQFVFAEVILTEADYTFPPNMKIRFQCDATGNQDDVFIDEVRVSAR